MVKAKWTVMVYLAGDNNLTDESIYAMTEMRRIGSGGGVNIITQFDPKDDYLPTHRYHIGKNGEPNPLPIDIIDTSKSGKFKDESDTAVRHADVRNGARRAAERAVQHEAEKAVQMAMAVGTRAGQAVEPVIETTLFEVLADPDISANDTDTGSPVTLYNFMSMCVQRFPAQHYMVVLAGHGAGTGKDFLLKDDSPAGSLTINELKKAFEELKPELDGQVIDILGMDVCLMSMAEVAYEMKGLVKIMVGAESYSPASGWPYEPILRRLKEEFAPAETEEENKLPENGRVEYRFAKAIVEEYVNFYADYWLGGLSVDQSALDVGEVEGLKNRIDKFAGALTNELNAEVGTDGMEGASHNFRDALLLAHWEAQSYNGELFVDLLDFCDCLLKRHKSGPVFDTGSELMRFIGETFVLKSCYSGPTYQYSNGVSIYFPWSKVESDYKNLDFVKYSEGAGWVKFLDAYTEKTRRPPRDIEKQSKFLRFNFILPQRFRNTQGKGPENLVRSMRNPPIIALANECIRERESINKGTEMLLS